MIVEQLKYSKLKNAQKKAYFSYDNIYNKGNLKLDLLSKTIAAMANAIGGEVFIGLNIEESKFLGFETQAQGFPSIEVIKTLILESIQPQIDNLLVETLESGILIKVPDSLNKPHILPNYKYYKRVLSKNQLLEEFEIRQLYQATLKSDLQIISLSNLQGIPFMSNGLFETMKFYPRVHVQNLGQRIEKDYKLKIAIPSFLVDESFTLLHKYLLGYEKDRNIYSIPATETLFQNESKIMLELVLKLNSENYQVSKILLKE